MAFERNDIVNKTRLMGELGEELMGYEHNDIVTVDVMEKAIAEGGGGGGETAQVTVINTTDAFYGAANPACYEANALAEGSPATVISDISVNSGETATFTVPLYKGMCMWSATEGLLFESSGDIEIDGFVIIITGDGTITISNG